MNDEHSRLTRWACGVVVALGSCAGGACGAPSSSVEGAPHSVATPETPADSDGLQQAESTVQAFFAVKGRVEDALSVRIDEQAVYLTERDVHPSAAYETGTHGRPSGISDSEVTVELSDPRWIDDNVRIDFEFQSTGVSYPILGEEVQLDEGTPQTSH